MPAASSSSPSVWLLKQARDFGPKVRCCVIVGIESFPPPPQPHSRRREVYGRTRLARDDVLMRDELLPSKFDVNIRSARTYCLTPSRNTAWFRCAERNRTANRRFGQFGGPPPRRNSSPLCRIRPSCSWCREDSLGRRRLEVARALVVDVPRRFEPERLSSTFCPCWCSRTTACRRPENPGTIVEAAVLLHDHYDVVDLPLDCRVLSARDSAPRRSARDATARLRRTCHLERSRFAQREGARARQQQGAVQAAIRNDAPYSLSGGRGSSGSRSKYGCVERGRNRHERARRLGEVEAVLFGRVRARVGRGQARQAELVLDELQNAAVLVLNVRDVTLLGIWRDDQQRHADAEPVVIGHRRRRRDRTSRRSRPT